MFAAHQPGPKLRSASNRFAAIWAPATWFGLWVMATGNCTCPAAGAAAPSTPPVQVLSWLPDKPARRAGRPTPAGLAYWLFVRWLGPLTRKTAVLHGK